MYNVQHIFISNNCCSFELSIYHRILKNMHHAFHENIKEHNRFQQ